LGFPGYFGLLNKVIPEFLLNLSPGKRAEIRSMEKSAKVLVTGGTGFVAMQVILQLLQQGYNNVWVFTGSSS
jgi:FlaA1/EpsC-like NDP-sugar epimerase